MRNTLLVITLLFATLIPTAALADTPIWNNPEANTNLAFNLVDMYTTRALLREPGTFERNPIAQPFVKTDTGALLYGVGANLLARLILGRSHPGVWHTLDALEIAVIANNVNIGSRRGVNFLFTFKR